MIEEDNRVVEPGWSVLLELAGFPPNSAYTVDLLMADAAPQAIGAGTTDAQGNGIVLADIPPETPHGSAELRVSASEDCHASVYVEIVGAVPFIDVEGDGDDFVPGGRLNVFATGFAPDTMVGIYLDGDPGDALCRCREIATASANADGAVEVRIRIPDDVAPGVHVLVAYGTSVDGISDVTLSIQILIHGARATMPPTDTVSAG